jgi:aspartate carbamoyltransferase catalytic subunit
MTKAQPPTRHIISINDLSNKEIETIFEVAQGFLQELADHNIPYRIGRSTSLASKFILASLFYEPSTRTRLSFESAMLRLGGTNITSADPAVSSAAKGESLADTIRVISNYADIVVIRHPRDGAVRLAAEYSQIPVINGGDGSHEHPTQTLCDLFTLRAKNKNLRNMKVAIAGDLKGSRTIHSFVYALARFGATIDPLPAPGMELPPHVDRRLREEFHSRMVSKATEQADAPDSDKIDALYVTADQPHQLSLYAEPEVDYGLVLRQKIDALYVTRFQKERWAEKERPYPKIDAKFLDEPRFSDASVMHPLPRVNELDASFDSDRRAVYFQQAAYGVPVRMALISLLLHLHQNKSLHQFPGGFAKPEHPIYTQPVGTGIQCGNPNCIVADPAERQYAANKFYVVEGASRQLRCVYCETDVNKDVAACLVTTDLARRTFSPGLETLLRVPSEKWKHFVIHRNEAEATEAGFQLRETGKKANAG